MSQLRRSTTGLLAAIFTLGLLALAALACQGNAVNMAILGIPKYVCPSATPKPTDTMVPPSPPTYVAGFAVNLDYYDVDPNRSTVMVQYLAQNVGVVQASVYGVDSSGTTWVGGAFLLAVTGNYAGTTGALPVTIPVNVINATVSVSSALGVQNLPITRYNFSVNGPPLSPPCCLPGAIYPTPRPTYTPYPTPTLFQMVAPTAFFLDDPIYNYQPPIQLRLRLKSPIQEGLFTFILPLASAAAWTIQITNVGQTEYDFLGAGYTFVTEVNKNGTPQRGVWAPSHYAAQFLNVLEQAYGPQAVQPGQTITITVAAWIPANTTVSQISLVLNPFRSGDPGWATFVPGSSQDQNQIHWLNQENTICKGEIQYP